MPQKIIIAITGASGSIYASLLLKKLEAKKNELSDIATIFSENAIEIWKHELGVFNVNSLPFPLTDNNNLFASCASGSSGFHTMIICPCSMGTLGRIASGVSTDLITRTADVMLKERRKLILVTRETPLSLIHIKNMETITLAGGIICPASPSFYSHPNNIEDVANTVVERIMDLAGIESKGFRWGE